MRIQPGQRRKTAVEIIPKPDSIEERYISSSVIWVGIKPAAKGPELLKKSPRDATENTEVKRMPRMSKKRKQEWAFFLNDRNRITYNTLCRKCRNDCKQSFRATVIECRKYQSKRSKQGGN